MVDELRKYIDNLFVDAPKTRASYELKEELMANSMERYFDLVEDKVAEKDAFDIVIHSIGDVEQLFAPEELGREIPQKDEEVIKKLALYRAIAVGLYILGVVFAIAVDEFTSFDSVGIMGMLLFAAVATSILVYVGAAYPKYKRTDDTMVEEFKEWNSNGKKKKSVQNSVNTIIWMVVLVLYFVISFVTMAWHITWVMFLIGICAQAIANLLFQLNDK